MHVRRHIDVSGIVQGVGFRPYVYRLATERNLAGTITNTPSGVTIEVQGPHESVADFVARLPQDAPPLARITGFVVVDLPCNGDRKFLIIPSRRGEAVRTLRPATYTIKVEAPGFRNGVRTRLVLAVSQQATVDFALSLASTKVKKIALVMMPKLWRVLPQQRFERRRGISI